MQIELKKLSELKPAPYNPRTSTKKQEESLKASLQKFGVVEPVIFNKQTGYIVGGHFRVRELKKLGFKEVECVIVDLSPEDERELNVRLNGNTGSWDWDILANDFNFSDLKNWGLEIPDMRFDDDPELEKEVINKITLLFPIEDDFKFVKDKLKKIADTREEAVMKLIQFYDENR